MDLRKRALFIVPVVGIGLFLLSFSMPIPFYLKGSCQWFSIFGGSSLFTLSMACIFCWVLFFFSKTPTFHLIKLAFWHYLLVTGPAAGLVFYMMFGGINSELELMWLTLVPVIVVLLSNSLFKATLFSRHIDLSEWRRRAILCVISLGSIYFIVLMTLLQAMVGL